MVWRAGRLRNHARTDLHILFGDRRYPNWSAVYDHALFSEIGEIRAVIQAVKELESGELPSSAEEGWLRGQEKIAQQPCSAQTGWCWSNHRLFSGPAPPRPLQQRMLRDISLDVAATRPRLRRGVWPYPTILSRLQRPGLQWLAQESNQSQGDRGRLPLDSPILAPVPRSRQHITLFHFPSKQCGIFESVMREQQFIDLRFRRSCSRRKIGPQHP